MQTQDPLAYLTADLPGVGGTIKAAPEDFRVIELPLYEACGEGTHVYFRMGKRGLATRDAIARVADALAMRPGAFSAAGLKDAQAVTEQTVSVEHLSDDQVDVLRAFQTEAVWVESVSRHTNKLKTGHLAGNRFIVRIRDVSADALPAARRILDVLARRGVPNYFGAQRFGRRGENAALGRAIIAGDFGEFASILLGRPSADDPPAEFRARELFDAGDAEAARGVWPSGCRNERNALGAWIRTGGKPKAAFSATDKFLKRFAVAAFQSELFNRVVEARIGELDRVRVGDLAKKSDSGGVFEVEDAPAEQPRAEAFEISPTGPLYGYRVRLATGEPGRIEQEILRDVGLTAEDWRRAGAFKVKGTRRPLRYSPQNASVEAGADARGAYLQIEFAAPPGSYATVLLRELCKNPGD